MKPAIRTFALTKLYGDVRALVKLDLEVHRGEVFGFLGPNGAGKTTTIRLLLDFIRPTSGRAEMMGLDTRDGAAELRRLVGNLPGEYTIYPQLTARSFLKLCSGGRPEGMRHAEELAERFSLDLHRRVGSLSRGNRQKAGLIQALMHDPELTILDEPTSGLDPLIREELYALISERRERGKTFFFSSHVLPELEQVCDRVGILRDGRLIAVENVEDLKRHKARRMEVTFSERVEAAVPANVDGVKMVSMDGERMVLSIPAGGVGAVIKWLSGMPVADVVFPEATLEEVFLSLYSGVNSAGGGAASEAAE